MKFFFQTCLNEEHLGSMKRKVKGETGVCAHASFRRLLTLPSGWDPMLPEVAEDDNNTLNHVKTQDSEGTEPFDESKGDVSFDESKGDVPFHDLKGTTEPLDHDESKGDVPFDVDKLNGTSEGTEPTPELVELVALDINNAEESVLGADDVGNSETCASVKSAEQPLKSSGQDAGGTGSEESFQITWQYDRELLFYEVSNFLWTYWDDVEYWQDIIQTHLNNVRSMGQLQQWATGKMKDWPCDAEIVYESYNSSYSSADYVVPTRLYLGSIASALRVDEIEDSDLCLVVTMNADDDSSWKHDEWTQHFANRNIVNLRFGGWDEINIHWSDWDRWVRKIVDFLMIWQDMVSQVLSYQSKHKCLVPGKCYSALVHCYGGVNRSGAAVLCLVMALEKVTLRTALDKSLLRHCPNRSYWTKRGYFIPALLLFQHMFSTPLESRPPNRMP